MARAIVAAAKMPLELGGRRSAAIGKNTLVVLDRIERLLPNANEPRRGQISISFYLGQNAQNASGGESTRGKMRCSGRAMRDAWRDT